MPNLDNASTINVIIRNKDDILFQDRVAAVTSYNDRGIFDILPGHENFISLIKQSVILHKTLKEKNEMKIENGIVRVYGENVYFYVNFAIQPEPLAQSPTQPHT